MMLSRTLKKISRNYRDYGPGVTMKKIIGGAFKGVFARSTYRIYRIKLKDHVSRDNGTPENLEFRFITERDDAWIERIEHLEDWLEGQINEKLRTGSLCLVAMEDYRLAGFNLVSFGKVDIRLIELVRSFGDANAWSEQITVHPAYRGKGLGAALRYRMFEELKSRGVRRFYGGALKLNTASLSLARKVGFREIIEVKYLRWLRFKKRRYVKIRP